MERGVAWRTVTNGAWSRICKRHVGRPALAKALATNGLSLDMCAVEGGWVAATVSVATVKTCGETPGRQAQEHRAAPHVVRAGMVIEMLDGISQGCGELASR